MYYHHLIAIIQNERKRCATGNTMQFKKIPLKETSSILYEDVSINDGIYYGLFFDKSQKSFHSEALGNAVYLNKKLINLDDYKQFFELSFSDCNGCNYNGLIFPRKKINTKEILELSNFGVMVDEKKAPYLVHTILNQEQRDNLTIEYIHNNLGFKEVDNDIVFLGDKGYNISSVYHGELNIQPCGNYETWLQLIKDEIEGYTPLELIVSISVAGVIKDFLKSDIDSTNLFVHLIGDSSSGKSTAGLLAVSLGASPNIADKSFVFTCNSTQNSIMNSISNSYPTLLDEGNQLFGDKTAFLYAIADGKERDRLSKELERCATNTFNTSIFLTSEKSIIDSCEQSSGLRVRILEFLNVEWTKSADSSDRIKAVIKNNYGYAIPMIAEYLVADDKENFIEWYNNVCQAVLSEMENKNQINDFSKRLSKIYALILCGAELCNEIFGLNFDSNKILDFLLEHNLLKSEESADLGIRAYQSIIEYVETHPSNFPRVYKKFHKGDTSLEGQSNGHNNAEGVRKDDYVYIIESSFKKILHQAGFPEPKVITKKLKNKGLLIPEAKDRYTSRFCLPDSSIRISGYCIKLSHSDET